MYVHYECGSELDTHKYLSTPYEFLVSYLDMSLKRMDKFEKRLSFPACQFVVYKYWHHGMKVSKNSKRDLQDLAKKMEKFLVSADDFYLFAERTFSHLFAMFFEDILKLKEETNPEMLSVAPDDLFAKMLTQHYWEKGITISVNSKRELQNYAKKLGVPVSKLVKHAEPILVELLKNFLNEVRQLKSQSPKQGWETFLKKG